MTTPVVAIDGTAASGKGTIARRLAAHYGFDHLDTGALYRRVGVAVLTAGADPADPLAAAAAARTLDLTAASEAALRSAAAGAAASNVAAVPAVRQALRARQQDFAKNPPGGKGAILDGRDIGTVVCPDADAKLWIDARPEIRYARRFAELAALGAAPDRDALFAELAARDARDAARADSPMKPAPDAVLLDTSALDIEAAFAAALAVVEEKLRKRRTFPGRG